MTTREKIAKMEAEIKALKEECMIDAWEMKPAPYLINNMGVVRHNKTIYIHGQQEIGMRLHTRKIAEKRAEEMKEINLLAYWVSVLAPDWEANFDGSQDNWFIYQDRNGKYTYDYLNVSKTLGAVYMPKDVAIKICKALNNGSLKLS